MYVCVCLCVCGMFENFEIQFIHNIYTPVPIDLDIATNALPMLK